MDIPHPITDLELLFRGALAGLAISAPVGPVNVLCISRTLTKGRAAGVISGLGAATADTVYGAIAGFSISFVIAFLIREELWIRLAGGILLARRRAAVLRQAVRARLPRIDSLEQAAAGALVTRGGRATHRRKI